jgi:hypothetical protein
MKNDEPNFYDLGQDSLDTINTIIDSLSLPFNIKKQIMGVTKQKKLIKLQKVNPVTYHMTGVELLIFINEDYLIAMEGENAKILIHQELDLIETDIAKGTFKLGKFRLQTNEGILNKYGIEAVANANQLSDLLTKQKKDGKETDLSTDEVKKKLKANKKSSVEFE